MDQIRNTILQHEASFKEQVKALHKLYSIQKSAMQEMRTMHSRAQILAYNSESHIVPDDRYGGSITEGKLLRPTYATSQAFKNESLALSLHPFYVLGYKGSGSLWMCKRGVETLQTAQSKQIRNFDLEKLPDEYIDEFENQSDPNTCKIADENSVSLKRTTNTSGDSQEKAYRRDIEKQISLHQGSLNFITAGYNTIHSENDPEKIPEQASGQIVEDNFPEDPVIRSQGSTILDSMQCDSTFSTGKSVLGKQDLNAFPLTSQTSKDHDFENPNDSGNGSNSIQSQYKKKSSEDKSGGSEAVQRGWRTKWSV
ncbi:hypothetical protein CJ030_MR8G012759 [Morella rubra]|uniref:Uncharacterized protein n=1 Tax=Morella rubra TaxID=262757 RepID=A0A6A1UYF3_9ROSI|nr:hypothetical protein CJ030_MR8G012759 [Morella rubra]